jgi:hypothetical protein
MNFTMIRNWVGQIGDDEFYDACDRHGIVVWQDFWLANPWDGPDPDDNAMFLRNVQDYVLRIRNHPSIGLYVRPQRGLPPKPIDDGIRATLAELHPGMHYIPSSADGVVSGHGPYQAMPPKFYFRARHPKLHSEMGMPNIVTLDSLKLMMPESAMWPQGPCGAPRFHPPARRAAPLPRAHRKELRRRRQRGRLGGWPSSSTTKATAPCSRRRARTAWACSSG